MTDFQHIANLMAKIDIKMKVMITYKFRIVTLNYGCSQFLFITVLFQCQSSPSYSPSKSPPTHFNTLLSSEDE